MKTEITINKDKLLAAYNGASDGKYYRCHAPSHPACEHFEPIKEE